MTTKQAIKVIKNGKRKVAKIAPRIKSATGPKKWSTEVKGWVSEFQKHRRDDSLTAFDSLFK
jgi:hypothetical protein